MSTEIPYLHPFALSEGVHFHLSGGFTFLYELRFKGKSSILFASVKGGCDTSKMLSRRMTVWVRASMTG